MSLKYLCHLTAPVTSKLSSDNHRGEGRWERNVVDALTTQGCEVHTTTAVWHSSLQTPKTYHDNVNQEWVNDSIQISYGVDKKIYTGYYPDGLDPKYRIVQYFDGPTEKTKDSFFQYDRKNAKSIICTHSFKAWEYERRLENVLGKENIEWVIGPTVPFVVDEADNFRKPILFWSYRNFISYVVDYPTEMKKLFDKLFSYMKEDPTLQLKILIHFSHGELYRNEIYADPIGWFLNLPFGKQFSTYKDRIELVWHLDWFKILEIQKETCLNIAPAEPLGGPPFEAGMYGIPMIFQNEINVFQDRNRNLCFPEVLQAPRGINDSFLTFLDQLRYDKDTYHKYGNACRNFIKQNATYEAYVNKIKSISEKRGWS